MHRSAQHLNEHQAKCGSLVAERNRYFTGKLLVPRDLVLEQEYFLSHHRTHNRLLHGWGVVCGLEVTWHPERDRCPDWVVVAPGIAIDCFGRELMLCEPAYVQLPKAAPEAPQQQQQQDQQEEAAADPRLFVFLTYHEQGVEEVPYVYDCNGHGAKAQHNRIRETAVASAGLARLTPECWPGAVTRRSPCRPCGGKAATTGCLEAACPCGPAVPIALVSREGDPPPEPDIEGRRRLSAPGVMTRIVDTNWHHGGVMTIEEIAAADGELRIWFDRELRPAAGPPGADDQDPAEATGINRFTFVLEYESPQTRTVEFIRSRRNPPRLDDDRCSAVFTLPEPYWRGDDAIRSAIVYVTLKCDFILDCNGNPVDGNFLRGVLPTGDGTWGGTFESWFRVR